MFWRVAGLEMEVFPSLEDISRWSRHSLQGNIFKVWPLEDCLGKKGCGSNSIEAVTSDVIMSNLHISLLLLTWNFWYLKPFFAIPKACSKAISRLKVLRNRRLGRFDILNYRACFKHPHDCLIQQKSPILGRKGERSNDRSNSTFFSEGLRHEKDWPSPS